MIFHLQPLVHSGQTEGRQRRGASKLMLRVGSGVETLGKMTVTAQSSTPHPLLREHLLSHLRSSFPFGLFFLKPPKLSFQHRDHKLCVSTSPKSQICQSEMKVEAEPFTRTLKRFAESPFSIEQIDLKRPLLWLSTLSIGAPSWLICTHEANAGELVKVNAIYETGELFELGIQLSYLLLLLALLGVGSFFVIRQVLVRRELDLSAKELQEQVRSGDASATELFELGAVMLRRKFYPAATKYLLQAIEKWDGDDQDLAQVYNALGVSYVRDGKTEKGIAQFEMAVKLQPGYVTAWNNLGDAYEKKKDLNSALKAFEEVLLFDPNNKVARPRRDALKEKVTMYKGVPLKSKKR